MDSRPPYQPRDARDRPFIHNPNHQPPPPPPTQQPPQQQQQQQQQQPPYSYAPPASQQAVHVPYGADPYAREQRRDPFLPQSAHQRNGSYGISGGNGPIPGPPPEKSPVDGAWSHSGAQPQQHHAPVQHQHHHHHQSAGPPPPPPPPMSGPNHPQNMPAYAPEHSRRGSIGAGSPPAGYYQPPRDSHPPPPLPHGNRNMPPPSPQKQSSGGPYQSQQRPPDPFTNHRELPSLGTSSHRPGSALSISSLIGGMNDSRSQPQHSPPLQAAASPPTRTMQPPSPRRAPSTGARNEYGMYNRPRTPERYPSSSSARPSEPRGYGASSPTRANSMANKSPDHQRQGFSGQGPPGQYKPMQHQEQRYYPGHSIPPRDPDMGGGHGGQTVPPRPLSQPSQGPGPAHERKGLFEPSGGYGRPPYGYPLDERRHEAPPLPRSAVSNQVDERQRDRPVTVQPVTHSAYSPPREQGGPGQQQPAYPDSRYPLYRPGMDDGRREVPRSDVTSAARPPFGAPLQHTSQHPSLNPEDPSRPPRTHTGPHPRMSDPFSNMPTTSDPIGSDRRLVEQLGHSGSSSAPPYQARGPPFDPQNQRSGHLGPEANRRTGRASPLPQAVQGASAQPVGPGGRPEIKSEFGRMFSGLGGGLGSAPSRHGTATPSRRSPLPQNGGESSFGDGEVSMARAGSHSGRRANKRVKDEDMMMADNHNADGRLTPSISRAGGKRSKHHHPPDHHHHHRAVGHHHHHVHHKPAHEHDDGQAAGQFNTIRLGPNGAPTDSTPEATHHHHHHHIVHPGHHHHTPRPIPPPDKLPESIYNITALLADASKEPSAHLGSQVYAPVPVPPSVETPLDDKFGYASMPNPLPSTIQGRVNCTFDIRIPRYFLTPLQRELVVKQRCVWGRDVYRDDSDPLGAAIHSGWILGAWGDAVSDVSILDDRCARARAPEDVEQRILARPAAPLIPPPDVDLILRILILPPLERYPSHNQYGITSRKAGNKYGGMSYTIQGLQWKDEGPGSRGQDRTREAKNNRMSAAQALLDMCLSTRTRTNDSPRNGTAAVTA
ncbi:Rxt3-domain-containing protein [Pseudovirgaria hyperparasitica]|uniref:Rxt3-domain-containing protein n=1 Tax=Pseudovirgaria hyperparasitica TaxID=470096 RepID=A0A6A6WJ62_9PEZI|nr:Rxt3-domain-containing protein [Pseudovirgaria hyperparasitica]KAF2762186.1 Rxt3-domain-containing protein [Pseudovirgaria hyperparasitica]